MTQADYVLDVLGGEAVFRGPRRSDPAELRTRIKRGLPYRSLESVCQSAPPHAAGNRDDPSHADADAGAT